MELIFSPQKRIQHEDTKAQRHEVVCFSSFLCVLAPLCLCVEYSLLIKFIRFLMSQSIQIYNGQGVNNACVQGWKKELSDSIDARFYRIEEFNSSYNAGFDRGNVALIILPDGNACTMFDPLLHLAEKIKQAIACKSSFLGSCAGAYLTASPCRDVYDFNPIPVYKASMFDVKKKSTFEVEWMTSKGHSKNDTCTLYRASDTAYLFEEIYPKDHYDCRILATYKSDISSKDHVPVAAILYQPSQSTPRLMTGLHPEIALSEADHCDADQLKNSELLRKEMCRSWFSELGIKVM